MISVKFGVAGAGEFHYYWREGEVYRQWRPTPEAEPAQRESTLFALEGAPVEALAMLQQQGFQP